MDARQTIIIDYELRVQLRRAQVDSCSSNVRSFNSPRRSRRVEQTTNAMSTAAAIKWETVSQLRNEWQRKAKQVITESNNSSLQSKRVIPIYHC